MKIKKGLKKIYSDIENINNRFNLSKKYPNYINKIVFRIGFFLVILFCLYLIFTFGFDKNWVTLECEDRSSCTNPYVYCQDFNMSNPHITQEEKDYCMFYNIDNCVGQNCNNSIINHGDYVGEKPPRIVTNGKFIILIITLFTFYFNHILYMIKKDN